MYKSTKIKDDIVWIGVNDRKIEKWESHIPLDFGVTYNSYVILDEKICIIDGVEEGENGDFFRKLEATIGDRKVDYIIINHVEPDHSGSIKSLLKMYPDIKVVGNAKSISILKLLDIDVPDDRAIVVKEKDILDLGKHKLTFYLMPMVHWPESMATYDTTDKILFSNDAFGSFGALDGAIFNDEANLNIFENEMRRYYSNIVGKLGAPVNAILKKLSSVEISCICPSHGLIWRKNIDEVIKKYQKWANIEAEEEGVVIIYGSMYGHTTEMAEILARQLDERGIKNVQIYDSSKLDISYLFSVIWKYKGLMIGTCTHYNMAFPKIEPLLQKLENYGLKNRYLGIFGNMLWSGGGVKRVKEFADRLTGLKQIGEPVEVKGHVTPIDREKLIELANLMADKIISDR
ncbi:FprA family A-type flavoprotein [Fusobacterium polymorphum]|uniref:FprA family A-type flavoprotein n=1 Tax=Fusobacterium nucleatum subsp. polymorphum TaxID=76857 RepID=UPI00300AFEF1